MTLDNVVRAKIQERVDRLNKLNTQVSQLEYEKALLESCLAECANTNNKDFNHCIIEANS